MIRFYLSAPPPSVNAMYRNLKHGRTKTAAYTAWIQAAKTEVMAHRAQWTVKAVEGPWNLSIVVGRTDARRRDIDNLIKAISDLCVSMRLVDDDADMEGVAASWSRHPGVVVEISQAPASTRRAA